MRKRKKKLNTPRSKRMNKEGRLQSAAGWLKKYNGNHVIRGYRKHFAVDAETAIAELRILGVPLSDEAVRNARVSAQAAVKAKQARKDKRQRLQEQGQLSHIVQWSDETYAFIAGYTEWGFPYGITWEEMEQFADQESLHRTAPPRGGKGPVSSEDERDWPKAEERDAEEVPFDLEAFMRYADEDDDPSIPT
ncbi:hypothetical protein [Cohnella nanjingensis]|uniref:Uncharacterized protein n=1 Tax=Cohnella nanjingensis TaxID=1387779 RepID=A0A7X0RRK1_9BACL|nr:hypothetical protein [Cohnella nanjingensis]MBB6672245.1 hypothetical protein [Cohnella nanjingensis]